MTRCRTIGFNPTLDHLAERADHSDTLVVTRIHYGATSFLPIIPRTLPSFYHYLKSSNILRTDLSIGVAAFFPNFHQVRLYRLQAMKGAKDDLTFEEVMNEQAFSI